MEYRIENPVKKLRQTQPGLRQIDLAECTGLSQRTIAGLEVGDCSGMHMRTAQKIARYFNISAAKLITDYILWRAENGHQEESYMQQHV
jgi:DNA-binding XRE family transcriptional regulator